MKTNHMISPKKKHPALIWLGNTIVIYAAFLIISGIYHIFY